MEVTTDRGPTATLQSTGATSDVPEVVVVTAALGADAVEVSLFSKPCTQTMVG